MEQVKKDPKKAFEIAAFKSHHILVDAIWGYTQFLLDEHTQRLLVVCAKSGLYRWTRMPFGPAPAPAEMQSYVHRKFGLLRDAHGKEFVTPLMDDIFISSPDFETHKAHCHIVFSQARAAGFEFKVKKGNFNKEKIGL